MHLILHWKTPSSSLRDVLLHLQASSSSQVSWPVTHLPIANKIIPWSTDSGLSLIMSYRFVSLHMFTMAVWNGPLWITCCCHSVAKLCPTLCDPMDCSTIGFPVLHYLLEFSQTHVH